MGLLEAFRVCELLARVLAETWIWSFASPPLLVPISSLVTLHCKFIVVWDLRPSLAIRRGKSSRVRCEGHSFASHSTLSPSTRLFSSARFCNVTRDESSTESTKPSSFWYRSMVWKYTVWCGDFRKVVVSFRATRISWSRLQFFAFLHAASTCCKNAEWKSFWILI